MYLVGDESDNILVGGADADTILGNGGNDFLVGLGGGDIIEGGDGNDYLTTLIGPSPLQPGSLLDGGAGNDLLESRNADDTLLGGDGDDQFSVFNYATTRTIDGGAGVDTLAFANALTSFTSGVTMDLNKGTQTVAAGVVLISTGIENLTGTAAADTLFGDSNANRLAGSEGDDVLRGRDGVDILIGGAGDDILDGGAGRDMVRYEDYGPLAGAVSVNLDAGSSVSTTHGNDTLISIEDATGTIYGDTLIGSKGDNSLSGGAGNDVLVGMGGSDFLDGGDGDDALSTLMGPPSLQPGSLLIGGVGKDRFVSGNSNDTMLGGAGDDTFMVHDYATTRYIDGGDGLDSLVFDYSPTAFMSGVTIDLNKGAQLVAPGMTLTVTSIEGLVGTAFGDTLIGDLADNTLVGFEGDDWLYGRGGADTLLGGNGDDFLAGGVGQDHLAGLSGGDTYFFASGDSVADAAGSGADDIQGFDAGDRLLFSGLGTPTTANYDEGTSVDFSSAAAQFNALLPLYGTLYAAYQVGSDVYVFAGADSGPNPGVQNVVKLQGVTTADIGVDQIFGS